MTLEETAETVLPPSLDATANGIEEEPFDET